MFEFRKKKVKQEEKAAQKIKQEEKATGIKMDRRSFLKSTAAIAGVGVGAATGSMFLAPTAAEAAYDRPAKPAVKLAVKELDTPPYNLPPYADADKLKRFNGEDCAFSNKNLLKEIGEEYGKPGMPVFAYWDQVACEKSIKGVEGWSLRDLASTKGGWANEGSIKLDWGENFSNPYQPVIDAKGKWDEGPEQNRLTVKKMAAYYGAGACGIAELNPQWLYSHQGSGPMGGGTPIEYTKSDVIINTPEKIVIPDDLKYVVVLLMPIDGAMVTFTPTGFNPVNGNGYSDFTALVNKVAVFIRHMGWRAIPCGNDTALSIPLAIDAGLGELGRHGLLINPEYGSACKICKVFTDMPLAVDKPISFGAAEFCKTCKKCAEVCPSKSISMEKEPSYEIPGVSNNPGMKKWYVNTDSCLKFWVDNGADGCNTCALACTYSKPQTWLHDVVKVTISKTSAFNSIFAKMDDAFGYGANWAEQEAGLINKWWSDASFTRTYNWTRHTF